MTRIGHHVESGGRSAFSVFAPLKTSVAVLLADSGERIAMAGDETGYWSGDMPRLPDGTRYWLAVDGRRLPDPASRRQPQGVHGPSEVVDVDVDRPPAELPPHSALVLQRSVGERLASR